MLEQQHAPFSVQIELVEGCNLRCPFCGINGIRGKERTYEYMERKTWLKVAKEIRRLKWTPRIEFAMHGEPSLHPRLVTAISDVRKRLPNLYMMVNSNGIGFVGEKLSQIEALKKAGLNVLGVNDYVLNKATKTLRKQLRKAGYSVLEYPSNKEASIYRKRKSSTFEIVFLEDIATLSSGNHVLANHAGLGAPPNDNKMTSRCAFPFRDLAIRWDGSVAICCDDFRGVYKIGNVLEMPLDKLWNNSRFRAARRKLYHGQRDFSPCRGCDAVSFRVGLLPDPTGQDSLPLPTAKDCANLTLATQGPPHSAVVKRPWEKR